MKKEMMCPVCHDIVYSEIGKGCKMCGMSLVDKSRDFCSKLCRKLYNKINKLKICSSAKSEAGG